MTRELPDQTEILDTGELMARCMGNLDFAHRILARFQGGIDQDVAALEEAVSADDSQRITRIAHRIKGASANVAAHAMRDLAAGIEDLARQQSLAEIPARLQRLRAEQSRLKESAALLGPPEQFAV